MGGVCVQEPPGSGAASRSLSDLRDIRVRPPYAQHVAGRLKMCARINSRPPQQLVPSTQAHSLARIGGAAAWALSRCRARASRG